MWPEEIMTAVNETADATGLFAENDVKVRITPYQYVKPGKDKNGFIHVSGYIMEGRTKAQKADLSGRIMSKLHEFFPDISFLAASINEFEYATCKKNALIDPLNTKTTYILIYRGNSAVNYTTSPSKS